MMMNRKDWRDVLAMLPGAGCFQHAPQHLAACWRAFLVTTCNWRTSLLLLLLPTLVKSSLLLPCAAPQGISFVTLEYSGECAEKPEYLRHPSDWFIDVLDSGHLVATEFYIEISLISSQAKVKCKWHNLFTTSKPDNSYKCL